MTIHGSFAAERTGISWGVSHKDNPMHQMSHNPNRAADGDVISISLSIKKVRKTRPFSFLSLQMSLLFRLTAPS